MRHPFKETRESIQKTAVAIQTASEKVQIVVALGAITLAVVVMIGIGLLLAGGE